MKISKVLSGIAASGLLAGAVLFGSAAEAADWSSTDVQYLYGKNYAHSYGEDDMDKGVLTLEHADGWAYGDNYFFVDISNPYGGNNSGHGTAIYGEWSPRLSIGKTFFGKELGFGGVVKDTFLAGNFEYGSGDIYSRLHSILIGPGFSLDLPGFAFADINFYARKSYRDAVTSDTGLGGQVTIDWLYPFSIGSTQWSFGGFADFAYGEKGGTSPKANNLITQPQLLMDVGALWGKPGYLKAGIEYDVWINKYGISNENESNPLAMVMWVF